MKHVLIAPVGDNINALFIGIRDFNIEKVFLITPKEYLSDAENAQEELKKFHIPVQIVNLKGNMMEEMFRLMGEIKKGEEDKNLIVNVATGDRMSHCAALSAAFVNGIKAFAVTDNEPMMLPVLRFEYYKLLTDKKMSILHQLNDEDCCGSLEELGRKTKMSLPLISYHVNGNLKSEGLKSMGLVETHDHGGRTALAISTMGRLLLKGYV